MPPGRRTWRARLILTTVVYAVQIEWNARRSSLLELCEISGVDLAGFDTPAQAHRPPTLHVAHRWWAVEVVLRRWPWGQDRPCLRRSLLLGRHLRHLKPSLCLEVVQLSPFVAHAWLLADGYRLDMGDGGPLVTMVDGSRG